MGLATALLLGAFAVHGATNDRPVISLDLGDAVLTNSELCLYEDEWKDLVGGDLKSSQYPGAPSHCDGNLLAKVCEVFSTPTSCPEPTAKGYDHHEGELVDENGSFRVSLRSTGECSKKVKGRNRQNEMLTVLTPSLRKSMYSPKSCVVKRWTLFPISTQSPNE